MAIAFAKSTIHSRAKGHSAVAASAYRTGTRLTDERTGIIYDFTNRKDVIFTEILLPFDADAKFTNREWLWNQAEFIEKRRDAQVSKDIILALPKELDLTQQIELARRFAQTHFVENGIPAEIAIHDHGDGNPHAHILVSTRRLEKNTFSKYKARDLNPGFYSGKVIEQDYWGEQWRDLQNDFFKEKNIDLVVDLNHLIPERHQGKIRDQQDYYLQQENELIRAERINIALHDANNLLNHISMTHSVFTRKDIERLVFKTLSSFEFDRLKFTGLVEKILHHQDVIYLGVNDSGKASYTTRNQYIAEANLLKSVEKLMARNNHVYHYNLDQLSQSYQLNDEQQKALHFIAKGSDLSVLVGRPGVGKSYLLKPVKDYYEANNCRVLGAALSGKVAKSLQNDSGISSSTIASLIYRIHKKKITLTKEDVIVIDEAGMVNFASLAGLLKAANEADAKVILVGDPDQLKPIQQGEIFRGIAAHTGYFELSKIMRQNDLGDREASLMLARGKVEEALAHYVQKKAVHLSEIPEESITLMINDWQKNISSKADTQENTMFAFTRAAVSQLNKKAREELKNKEIIGKEEFSFDLINQDTAEIKNIDLSVGERILFKQNNADLKVRNGDMAFIESIDTHGFTAKLDSGETVSIPKTYQHVDYGYATTVHKGQGMTLDNSFVLIDSQYWDKHLSYVAMTRHRKHLGIYVDKYHHPTLEILNKTLSRAITKDNVIDWPFDLALRHGFEPDSLIGKIIHHLSGVGQKIKETYNYVVNYEAFARQKMTPEARGKIRNVAKQVADYLDEQATYTKLRQELTKKSELLKVEVTKLDEFKLLYVQSVERDKKAYTLWTENSEQLGSVNLPKIKIENLQRASERHERYLTVLAIVDCKPDTLLPEHIIKQACKIDMTRDKVHVIQLAAQFKKTSTELFHQIEGIQKLYQHQLLNQLQKKYPVLVEYDKLFVEQSKSTGFKKEKLDALLITKAHEIIKEKSLYIQLQRDLPKFARSLTLKTNNRDIVLGRE